MPPTLKSLLQKLGMKKDKPIADESSRGRNQKPAETTATADGGDYDEPASFANLSETADPAPVENVDENARTYRHHTLEEERGGR